MDLRELSKIFLSPITAPTLIHFFLCSLRDVFEKLRNSVAISSELQIIQHSDAMERNKTFGLSPLSGYTIFIGRQST